MVNKIRKVFSPKPWEKVPTFWEMGICQKELASKKAPQNQVTGLGPFKENARSIVHHFPSNNLAKRGTKGDTCYKCKHKQCHQV